MASLISRIVGMVVSCEFISVVMRGEMAECTISVAEVPVKVKISVK